MELSRVQTNAVVVTSQPVPQLTQPPMLLGPIEGHRDWSSGLFDCFEDCGSCLFTWFCECGSVITVATRTGECCCMPLCVPGAGLALRARIRTLGGIRGSICNDCIVTYFCGPCAVCQMQRELTKMGL